MMKTLLLFLAAMLPAALLAAKDPWFEATVQSAALLTEEDPWFEGRFLAPDEELPQPAVPLLLAPHLILPEAPLWRWFASENATQTLIREQVLPDDHAVLRYPAGMIRLFYWNGDVYGEFGNFSFFLPESELSKRPLPGSRSALARPFIRDAFHRLVNAPPPQPTPPYGGKARYTARITDLPLRRGISLPDNAGEKELKHAVAAGANLLRARIDNCTEELLDAAQTAGISLILDTTTLSDAALYEFLRKNGQHPALAGVALGGAPGAYSRAMGVREIVETLPLYLAADAFLSPDGFAAQEVLPLHDVIYTADLQRDTSPSALLEFQQKSGAMVSVRVLDARQPRRLIDAIEKRGWEWTAPYPAQAPYTHLFRRNRR